MKLSALEFQLREESVRGEASLASLAELQQISARLQDEVLRVDKEKIR